MSNQSIPLGLLDGHGSNAPVVDVADYTFFNPPQDLVVGNAVRHRSQVLPGNYLDSLLVNKGHETLVVGFHGALNQEKAKLPRFERLSTILGYDVSCMFFGDPSLYVSEKLQLAWYTGWNSVDLQRVIASWAVNAAKAIGARRIIFTGSSGGGFAALQISALVPKSYAVVFNAQTDIAEYRINGEGYGAQRTYVQTLWPEIAANFQKPSDIESGEWKDSIGESASAIDRYSRETENYAFIYQNAEEFHFEDHFLPFLAAAKRGNNISRIHLETFLDGPIHAQPRAATFDLLFRESLQRIEALPFTI